MFISPDSEKLAYSGRIDDTKPEAPVFVYPCSYVKMRFTGGELSVFMENNRVYWDNYMGYILDGEQNVIRLEESGRKSYEIRIPDQKDGQEDAAVHEIMLFKRMDACHHVTFYGFEIEDGGQVLDVQDVQKRRMEFYGDSVSAGEVSEAVEYAGLEDPVHNGEYSNSWYSYAWMTARKLNAGLHDIAQGGIALMDRTGWFCEPDYVGMESVYDKIQYQPQLGESRQWDFSRYTPHVVVIAIGQNDSNPRDYMADEPDGEQALTWKRHYEQFVRTIRDRYPQAVIILTTTILQHNANWDDAIGEVCQKIGDPKLYHFLYSKNGCGTPGHIRIPEAEQMSEELSGFINSLGGDIWA